MRVEIRPLGTADEHAVLAARSLFDHEPDIDATRRFRRSRPTTRFAGTPRSGAASEAAERKAS